MSITTLTELEEIVFLESGEYLLQNLENVSLDAAKFWVLVKRVLRFYNSKRPFHYKRNLTVNGNFYTYQDGLDYGPPAWVSTVVPVTSSNVMDVYSLITNRVIGETSMLEIPRGFAWKYENPKLYVSENGTMDVIECHDHQYTTTTDSGTGAVTDVEITTINERDDPIFFDMCVARFLMVLGRSRRAFTMNDLPISMDGSELVSEGQELWDKSIEKIEENDKWWLALGEGTGV